MTNKKLTFEIEYEFLNFRDKAIFIFIFTAFTQFWHIHIHIHSFHLILQ